MFTKSEAHKNNSALCGAEVNASDTDNTHVQHNKADNQESPLHSMDEHYVGDIAMMSIAEEVGQQRTAQALDNTIRNGDELEIDRQEEEQAINQLVRSSSGGSLMEPLVFSLYMI